jgi:integrase
MPKPKLPFLQRRVSRHGKVMYYVRLSKRDPLIRIGKDHAYRSDKFIEEYHAAVRGAPITPAPVVARDGKGTVSWLINLYKKSRAWCEEISQETRNMRGPFLKRMEEEAGDLPLPAITRAKIEEGISSRSQNQGRHFFDCMRGLFKFALAHELYDRDPTAGIIVKKGNGEGHLAWPIDLIEKFERRWPVGSKERLIFDVYLYTGLRRGDAARLGKQHIRNNLVHLMTEKSQGRMPVFIPVHPALAASIAASPSKGLAIIAKDDGTNYAKEALGNMFREAIEGAGIPITKKNTGEKGYTGHGLRKASATIAAESGASESELNAMFGWTGHEMAQLYTKKADRKRLAARAMAKWTRPSPEDLDDASISYLQLEKERA